MERGAGGKGLRGKEGGQSAVGVQNKWENIISMKLKTYIFSFQIP